MGVSESRGADQQKSLFCFLKDQLFCFFLKRTQGCLGRNQWRIQKILVGGI